LTRASISRATLKELAAAAGLAPRLVSPHVAACVREPPAAQRRRFAYRATRLAITDISTTQIYTHVVEEAPEKPVCVTCSPRAEK